MAHPLLFLYCFYSLIDDRDVRSDCSALLKVYYNSAKVCLGNITGKKNGQK
jgi:hypothetical protein